MAAKRRAVAHGVDGAAQRAPTQSEHEARARDDRAEGWYLYGITGAGTGTPAPETMAAGVFPGGPVEAFAVGGLVAVVQRYTLSLHDALPIDRKSVV